MALPPSHLPLNLPLNVPLNVPFSSIHSFTRSLIHSIPHYFLPERGRNAPRPRTTASIPNIHTFLHRSSATCQHARTYYYIVVCCALLVYGVYFTQHYSSPILRRDTSPSCTRSNHLYPLASCCIPTAFLPHSHLAGCKSRNASV